MLVDPYGRKVTNLRISLTQRCNLACIYCHAEGEKTPSRELPRDQIAEILSTVGDLGIRKIKFTGGEPLLRKDVCDIVQSVPAGIESSMTTNGILLADVADDLKGAGLSRVNVSLDTLDPERYVQITGRNGLSDVLSGIDAALDAGLTPVKLNMVLLKGVNEDEIERFLQFVRDHRHVILQLIELLEFNDCTLHADVGGVEREFAEHSEKIHTRRMQHRRKYCLDGAEVEVVRPLHNTEFCKFCNRLRITSDGKLKPCLLRSNNHLDIEGKTGEELKQLFLEAVQRREPYFR
ncbi:MAG: GTP 3',8-cyclase MoaA [Methanomicrobiales archaeon]|nr:GTP 3',8-cyclase MoaA [Methanomicrobiales archaeon]